MTREEQDEKEFGEWYRDAILEKDRYLARRQAWLASRRLLREKGGEYGWEDKEILDEDVNRILDGMRPLIDVLKENLMLKAHIKKLGYELNSSNSIRQAEKEILIKEIEKNKGLEEGIKRWINSDWEGDDDVTYFKKLIEKEKPCQP